MGAAQSGRRGALACPPLIESGIGRIISIIAAGLLFGVESVGQIVGQSVSYPPSAQGGFYTHNYYFAPAPSSTPWSPAWSPDVSKIAVAMSGSIWIVAGAPGAQDFRTLFRAAFDALMGKRQ